MSDDDSGGFDLRGALDNADPVETIRTALGLTQTAHVCPDCGVACDPSHTYNAQTAAFDGGACPSWECPECSTHFVREVSDQDHGMDLYGRD